MQLVDGNDLHQVLAQETLETEAGSGLISMETFAAFRAASASSGSPFLAVASQNVVAVAADRSVLLFDTEQLNTPRIVELDADHVDVMCFDSASAFLVCGDRQGVMHFIHLASGSVVLSQTLFKPTETGKVFQAAAFRKAGDVDELFVLAATGALFRFSNMALAALDKAVDIVDRPTMAKVKAGITMDRADLGLMHSGVRDIALTTAHGMPALAATGTGEHVLSVWSTAGGVTPLDGALTDGVSALKVRASKDGSLLVVLSDTGVLSVWDAEMLFTVAEWPSLNVQDFEILPWMNQLTVALRCYSKDGASTLSVRALPTMDEIYSVPVSPRAILGSPAWSALSMTVLEPTTVDGEQVMRVRSLKESVPHQRFQLLISTCQYAEAMAFAAKHGLSTEDVAKAQCSSLLLEATAEVKADTKGSAKMQALIAMLDSIADHAWALQFCLDAPNTVGPVLEVLARHAFTVADRNMPEMVQKIADVRMRLDTFVLVGDIGADFNCDMWHHFRRMEMSKAVSLLLAKGRVRSAVIVWRRHWRECSSVDTALALLSQIPEDAALEDYEEWLRGELLPLVDTDHRHEAEKWLEQRAKSVEERERRPHNALTISRLLLGAQAARLTPGQQVASFMVRIRDAAQASKELTQLQAQLEDMVELYDKYQIRLSLSAYVGETPQKITRRMLERVSVPDLLEEQINSHVRPYAARHNLHVDTLLLDFLLNWMETMAFGQEGKLSSVSSEQRALAIINCIAGVDQRAEAVMELLRRTAIPWSDEIDELMQSSSTWSARCNSELLELQRTMRLKLMLLKYGIKAINVNNESQCRAALRHILSRTDVEDAMEDGLQFVQAFSHISRVGAFVFRIQKLLQAHNVAGAEALLRSLDRSTALVGGQQLVTWCLEKLEEPDDNETSRCVAAAAMTFLRHIAAIAKQPNRASAPTPAPTTPTNGPGRSLGEDGVVAEPTLYLETERLLSSLSAVSALQSEYGVYISVAQFEDPDVRRKILLDLDPSVLEKGPVVEAEEGGVKEKKGKKTSGTEGALNTTKLFRLVELLSMTRDEFDSIRACRAAETGHMQRALTLCKELYQRSAGPTTASALSSVAQKLMSMTEQTQNVDEAIAMPTKASELLQCALVSCAEYDLPGLMDLFKDCDMVTESLDHCETGLGERDGASVSSPYAGTAGGSSLWDVGSSARISLVDAAAPAASSAKSTDAEDAKTDNFSRTVFPHHFREDMILLNPKHSVELASAFFSHVRTQRRLKAAPRQEKPVGKGKGSAVPEGLDHVETEQLIDFLRGHGSAASALRLVNHAESLGLPNVHSFQQQLVDSLLIKLLGCRALDHGLALGYMSHLSQDQAFSTFKGALSRWPKDCLRLQKLGQIGTDMGVLWKQENFLGGCKTLTLNAQWWQQLQLLNIAFDDKQFAAKGFDASPFVAPLLAKTAMDITTVQAFANDYAIPMDTVCQIYVKMLVLGTTNLAGEAVHADPVSPPWDPANTEYKDRIACVRDEMPPEHYWTLLTESVWPRLPEYDYDRIEWAATEIVELAADVRSVMPDPAQVEAAAANAQLALSVLRIIAHHRKLSSPSDKNAAPPAGLSPTEETQRMWRDTRLPFFKLVSFEAKDAAERKRLAWEVIKPELGHETIRSLVNLADLLGLSVDDFSVKLIENILDSGRATHEAIKLYLHKLQQKNAKRAVEVALDVAQRFPLGPDRLATLKFSVQAADKWKRSMGDDQEATATFVRVQKMERDSQTEFLLRQNKLEEFIPLIADTNELLSQLYSKKAASFFRQTNNDSVMDLHSVVENIAARYCIDDTKLREALVPTWLNAAVPSSSPVAAAAAETELLERVAYLMQKRDTRTQLNFLFSMALNDKSTKVSPLARARAIQVAHMVCAEEDIKQFYNQSHRQDFVDPRMAIQRLMYLNEFEKLRLPITMDDLRSASKEGLVMGLWKNHSHLPETVKLVCKLCLDFEIFDAKLWDGMLKTFIARNEVSHLLDLLENISGVPALAQLPTMQRVWQSVIGYPIQQLQARNSSGVGDNDEGEEQACTELRQQLSKAVTLLQKCPFLVHMDVAPLVGKLCSLGMTREAVECAVVVPQRQQRAECFEMLRAGKHYIELLDVLSTSEHEQVVCSVFDSIMSDGAYELLRDTRHFQLFVQYVITVDRIQPLVAYLLENSRLKEAEVLVRHYHNARPSAASAVRLAEATKKQGVTSSSLGVKLFVEANPSLAAVRRLVA